MVDLTQSRRVDSQHLGVPAHPLLAPVVEPSVVFVRLDKVLELHQLELAHAKHEVAGRDLVAECATLLRYAERHADARGVDHVLEVDEHALRRLGPQVHR